MAKNSEQVVNEERLIKWMARAMKKKLMANRRKGGWDHEGNAFLIKAAKQKLRILEILSKQMARSKVSASPALDRRSIAEEMAIKAADVANFTGMVVDNANGYDLDHGYGRKG